MDANAMQQQGHEEDDEEEFALLDLDVLSGNFDIPPNAPYVLSVCGNCFFFKHLLCAHRLIIFALSLSLLHYVWPIKGLSFEIRYYAKQIETVCMYAYDL